MATDHSGDTTEKVATDDVAAALDWFGMDTTARLPCMADVMHGVKLATEVRRMIALVEVQERRWVELQRWNFYEHGLTSVDSNRLADKMKELEGAK